MTFGELLGAGLVPFALLTGSTPASARKQALNQLASGELGLVVGTHALIEPTVEFARLGASASSTSSTASGVGQRAALDAKGPEGLAPHVLHMTATPIPRTLSLTAYGDLDSTVLRELPAGRRPVRTDRRRGGGRRLRAGPQSGFRDGRQAFVVCPLVSESEKLQGKAAEVEAERLAAGELRDFEVGVLHGQMPAAKAEAMRAFAAGETDVLVATTVIEVGIDVPNATVMVIEGAERYGVSQLHQLRGRVGGASTSPSASFFPRRGGDKARRRLKAVAGETTASSSPRSTWRCAARARCSAPASTACRASRSPSCPRTRPLLLEAREEVLALLREHGSLEAAALGPLLDAPPPVGAGFRPDSTLNGADNA